ncbi:MAG: hypothetical protein ACPIG6_06375 [Akkermansiaceae bacterium]
MKMSLDSTGVKAGIGKATDSIKGFATSSMERLQKVGNFFKTGLVVGAGFLVGIKKSIDGMVEMKRSADRLGVSTESFQKLSFAAKQTGVDTDRLADAMKDLDVKLQDGIMRGGSFAELIQELGMDMNELAKMPADQRMLAFADAIKNASGSLSRFGADEFGDAMFELLPLLEMGSDGILELGNSAVIASDQQLAAAEAASRFLDSTTSQVTSTIGIWVAEGIQFFQAFVAAGTQAFIELGNIFGNLGDIIVAALKMDWDGVKAGYDKMANDAEGAFDRIGQAMDDQIDEQIAAGNKVDKQRSQMTDDEIARLKKMGDERKKRAGEREKSLKKAADLEKKAADEREKRDMAAMSAQEKIVVIQNKILDIRQKIDDLDPFADDFDEQKARLQLELEQQITEEGKAQADAIDEQIAARDAAMEQQMKGLELERAMASAMGDNQRVNALDRQIERQSMINELLRNYIDDEGLAATLVDNIIRQKEIQKEKELEVLKAQADGNDMLATQLQGRIDKEQEAIDLMNEFNLSLDEAVALAGKLAAMRAGPDLNQSGFVTPREQREFDRRQAEIERGQERMRRQELAEERQLGGGLMAKRIPADISREQRAAERAEKRERRADIREAQRRMRRGEDPEALMEEMNRRRDQRDVQKRAQEAWEKAGRDPDAKFDLNGNVIPPGDPRLDPQQPQANPVVDALGPKLDKIDTSVQQVVTALKC